MDWSTLAGAQGAMRVDLSVMTRTFNPSTKRQLLCRSRGPARLGLPVIGVLGVSGTLLPSIVLEDEAPSYRTGASHAGRLYRLPSPLWARCVPDRHCQRAVLVSLVKLSVLEHNGVSVRGGDRDRLVHGYEEP